MTSPHRPTNNPMYQLLLSEDIIGFNKRKTEGQGRDLVGVDLRGADLRGLDASGVDLRDAYMRKADLRGIDRRETQLEGASLMSAKIFGTYFPDTLHQREVVMSV